MRLIVNPQSIWRFPISGAITQGTALVATTTTPAHILTQDTASLTVIADTAVGTISMAGGLIKGKTGANAGAIRKISSHSNNTSCTVTIGFVNSVAVGDTLIRVPYSRHVANISLTTDRAQANGILATGTGLVMSVVNVIIDEVNNLAYVDAVARDAFFNPESA